MSELDMINEIKLQIGRDAENVSDEVIGSYLKSALTKVLQRLYPFDIDADILPARYEPRVIEIAVYLFAKRGAEGQLSHSENGVNRTYASADIPDEMLNDIMPFVGVL